MPHKKTAVMSGGLVYCFKWLASIQDDHLSHQGLTERIHLVVIYT